MHDLTLGSLFDGSGGFPLAGLMNGIRPVWASEVEPFPIRVTTKRLPMMQHLGDVNAIDGGAIPPVDIVTFGSPCTDISCAGRRVGLNGEKSSLFFQAIRIITEMRRATHGAYPKYLVFENVPGLYSSNACRDFRVVLEEISQIASPGVSVPMPQGDKWLHSGEIMGEGFSVAWRSLDAQRWGVPQRRMRIYLVCDLTGGRAGKILFEHESLSGYSPQSFDAWAATSACAASGIALARGAQQQRGLTPNVDSVAFEPGILQRKDSCHAWENLTGTLRAEMGDNRAVAYAILNEPIPIHDKATRCKGGGPTRNDDGAGNGLGVGKPGDPLPTMTAGDRHAVCYQPCVGTLCGTDYKWMQQQQVAQDKLIVERETFSRRRSDDFKQTTIASTQVARQFKDATDVVIEPLADGKSRYIIRRLTAQECAKLQGFPAHWCSDLSTEEPTDADLLFWSEVFAVSRKVHGLAPRPKSRKFLTKWLRWPHSDSAEYRMWGNGICVNIAAFVLAGIVWVEQQPTA